MLTATLVTWSYSTSHRKSANTISGIGSIGQLQTDVGKLIFKYKCHPHTENITSWIFHFWNKSFLSSSWATHVALRWENNRWFHWSLVRMDWSDRLPDLVSRKIVVKVARCPQTSPGNIGYHVKSKCVNHGWVSSIKGFYFDTIESDMWLRH